MTPRPFLCKTGVLVEIVVYQAMEVHAKLRTLDKSNSSDSMAWVTEYR